MKNFKDLKQGYKNTIYFLVTIIICLSIAMTYAFFNIQVLGNPTDNTISLESGVLSLRFEDNNQIYVSNVLPGFEREKVFTVSNTGSYRTFYTLKYENIDNTFLNDEIVITYHCVSYINYGLQNQQTRGECPSDDDVALPTEDGPFLTDVSIGVGVTHVYTSTIEFLNLNVDQYYNQEAAFNGRLVIESGTQTFKMTGRVVDEDNNAIVAANIDIDNGDYEAITDTNGAYEIEGVSPGVHNMIITSNGEEIANGSFTLYVGANTAVSRSSIAVGDEETIVPLEIVADNEMRLEYKILPQVENKSLYQQIIDAEIAYEDNNNTSSTVNSATGINFSSASSSSNGTGLFYTDDPLYKEGDNRIYYYRGAVLNNNVSFGGFCWKIIRTTEDLGVKMIYNGPLNGGACTNIQPADTYVAKVGYHNVVNDNAYVGYKIGTLDQTTYEDTHTNSQPSRAKSTIDNWYDTNLGPNSAHDYTSYLEDAEYCNDRMAYTDANASTLGNGFGDEVTYYGAYKRVGLYSRRPSFKCTNNNDKYTVANHRLTFPVALITADEVSYAGGYSSGNTSYYLHNGNVTATMSPSKYNGTIATLMTLREDGSLVHYDGIAMNMAMRPVLTLSNNVKYADGDGSEVRPYTIRM